jgi:hypothetical protein
MNLREKILQKQDHASEIVHVPEWDVKLEVRSLSGKERAWLIQHHTLANGKPDLEKMLPALIISTAYDPETGEKVFNPADRDAVNQKNGFILERLADVSMRVNKLRPEDLKEAEKN